MYPVCQLFCEAPAAMPSPYPFDVSRLSTGSALTAASPRLGGALSPALSWGHAATGHPWPIAAAIDRKAVAEPEHAVCLKNREADFTTAASQWRTKPNAASLGSSAATDSRLPRVVAVDE